MKTTHATPPNSAESHRTRREMPPLDILVIYTHITQRLILCQPMRHQKLVLVTPSTSAIPGPMRTLTLCFVLCTALVMALRAPTDKPNIVMLFVDDLVRTPFSYTVWP